jgi:hypothetical protein
LRLQPDFKRIMSGPPTAPPAEKQGRARYLPDRRHFIEQRFIEHLRDRMKALPMEVGPQRAGSGS